MREAQRARTRQAIVRAAARLLARGERPGLDEVAAEADVSRATAYRYFPGVDALLSEAAVDALVPETALMFDAAAPDDVAARLAIVDDTLDRVTRDGEVPLRMMLARILERSARHGKRANVLRQNRRTPMIEQALEPLGERLKPRTRRHLVHALAIVIGTEGFLALNDVIGLDEAEARDVRRWAIDALLSAALAE